MVKTSEKMFQNSLVSVSFLTIMASTSVSPLLGCIAQTYPSSSPVEVKMILTLPSVVSLVFSQLCGLLSLTVSKKKLLMSGIGLYTFGGCLSIVPMPLPLLIFLRGIIGAGLGIITPLSTGLIVDYYSGQRGIRLIGISQAVAQVGSMAGTLISGLIADINWHFAFLVYTAGVPVFILVLLTLPETNAFRQKHRHVIRLREINKGILPIFTMALLFSVVFASITTNISQYVKGLKLKTDMAGVSICIMALGGLIGSAVLPKILKSYKNFTLPLLLSLIAAGFLFLAHSTGVYELLFSLLLLGFSGGAFSTGLYAVTAQKTVPEQHTLGMAFVNAGNAVGTFLTPYLFSVTALILHTDSLVRGFYANSIEMFAETVFLAFFLFISKNNKTNEAAKIGL